MNRLSNQVNHLFFNKEIVNIFLLGLTDELYCFIIDMSFSKIEGLVVIIIIVVVIV